MTDADRARPSETAAATSLASSNTKVSYQSAPPAPHDDLSDRTVLHFRVVARLGAGGMGVVYRALDEKLRRPVALKVLSSRYVADERNREMIFREARSAAAVTHPNIATIYEVHDAAGLAFIAMELVEGESLRARIDRGPLPLEEATAIAKQIADGLAHAHRAGIVHRDVKPENVMCSPEGRVKLLDFGLARALHEADPVFGSSLPPGPSTSPAALAPTIEAGSSGTRAGRVMGTPAYMAPEQARGEPLDARADIFAFGVVLYEMLTGKKPFERASELPWEWGGDGSPEWTCRARVTDVSPGGRALGEIVARCLRFAPAERFATMTDVGRSLADVPPPSRGSRAPRIALFIAALAAVLALAFVARRAATTRSATSASSAASTPTIGAPRPPRSYEERRLGITTTNLETGMDLLAGGDRLAISTKTTLRLYSLVDGHAQEVPVPPPLTSIDEMTSFPDGKALLVAAHAGKEEGLWRVPLDGGSPRKLRDGSYSGIQLSPDGLHLAYQHRGVFAGALEGAEARLLAPAMTDTYVCQVAWSPTGDRLAILTSGPSDDWIDLVDPSTGLGRRVLHDPSLRSGHNACGLAWTEPHGLLVARYPVSPARAELLEIPFDARGEAGPPRTVFTAPEGDIDSLVARGQRLLAGVGTIDQTMRFAKLDPPWSRFAAPLASVALHGNVSVPVGAAPEGPLFFAIEEGRRRIDLVTPRGVQSTVYALPAGSRFGSPSAIGDDALLGWLRAADAGADCELVRISATTGALRPVPSGSLHCHSEIKCPHRAGSACVAENESGSSIVLQTFDPTDGRVGPPFATIPSELGQWGVSPEGSTVVYLDDHERGHVVFVRVSNGATRSVDTGEPHLEWFTFAPDGTHLFATVNGIGDGTPSRLVSIDAAGKVFVLWDAERGTYLAAPTMLPDARTLAFYHARYPGDVRLLEPR